METLLDAVAALVCLVSPDKVQGIAGMIRRTHFSKSAGALTSAVGTPAAVEVVNQLTDAWRATRISADELASMLIAGAHVYSKVVTRESTEFVWTGPTTPFVSARRTEQVLLQVINAAQQTLFITSFVAYDVSTIVNALNAAGARGVDVSMLLESSHEFGGSISFNAIGKMKSLIPSARLYAWQNKTYAFENGCVHAKVAVADASLCFITSANLTGHAMERNMEAGVLHSGGNIPRLLNSHLRSLVETRVVVPV